MSWSKLFFWIAAFVGDAVADNPNGIKTFLANCVRTFINGKAALGNEARRLSNPSFWLLFLVVSFNKIPLFSKDLITL